MELLAECEEKYRAPAPLSFPPIPHFPLALASLFNPRYAPSSPAIQDSPPPSNERWGAKRKVRKRDGKKERKKKGDASIHGESIVSFISVPRADYLFRFPAGRAPRRSPYCDSVIVVRFWKIAHCESILKTGGLTESSSRFLRISGTCREAQQQDRMLIFLRLTSRFISFLAPFHVERPIPPLVFHIPTPSFICSSILGFTIRDRAHSQRARCVKKIYAFPSEFQREKW